MAEELELNEVVGEVVALSRARAQAAQLGIEHQPSGSNLKVRGDRVQLQQVLLNLIMNGIDATESPSTRDRNILSGASKEGTSAIISVRDHGAGIPADQLENIFESFVTTKDDGMGMGLSIARTIVAQRSAGAAEERLAPVMALDGPTPPEKRGSEPL
jgi:C4-dicarboxylate-specific signal transduction histidine kinase